MLLKELRSKLEKLAGNCDWDPFFREAASIISTDSSIHSLLVLLQSRHTRLKMDRIKGGMSKVEEKTAEEELQADVLDFISLIEEDCLVQAPADVKSLWKEIDKIQAEMESVTNVRADGVIKAGQALQKLGDILRGETGTLAEELTPEALIRSAVAKASRRMTIAGKEIKAIKKYQYQVFNSMERAYRDLLEYLDYPAETPDSDDLQMLHFALDRLKNYVLKLEEGSESIRANFGKVMEFLEFFLSKKQELGPLIKEGFAGFEQMKLETQSILEFYKQDDETSKILASRLKALSIELELSIGELDH